MNTSYKRRIVIDIETNSKHDHIHIAVTKDIDSGEVKVWSNPSNLWAYIEGSLLIGHNLIGFDAAILNRIWKTKIKTSQCFDTLVLSRLLDPSRSEGHSLEAWGKTLGNHKADYLGIWKWLMQPEEYVKGMEWDQPHMPLLIDYCKQDVNVTEQLFHHLVAQKEEKGFSDESVELEHKVAAIIAQQVRNGFKLDVQYTTSLLADIKREMDGVYEQLQQRWPPYIRERYSEKTGKQLKSETITFNPGSRQQIGEKLIELGWKPEKLTETGQPMVDEVVLMSVDIPEAKMIARYLLLQKRVSQIEQWFDALGDDGRIHGRVITNGAVTGRATHSSPNMGQIPNTSSVYGAECRRCWTVEEGMEQVGIDLSGIELRCLSHYMQDEAWQHELLKGDVHWKNTQAFGLVPMGTVKTDSKEHKDARNLSKTLTYSVLYGAGPAKVGSTVGGGAKEGKKLIDNFMQNTPALKRLMKKLEPYIAKGYVPGLDGRKVWIRSEHAALNSLLQSAGAIIAKQWIVCMSEELHRQKVPYKLLAWVHDELQCETPIGYGDIVGKISVEAARKAGDVLKFRCPVDAEYRTGSNWFDCH